MRRGCRSGCAASSWILGGRAPPESRHRFAPSSVTRVEPPLTVHWLQYIGPNIKRARERAGGFSYDVPRGLARGRQAGHGCAARRRPAMNPFTLRGSAMKEMSTREYKVKLFELTGLDGISTLQIETHLELYVGYVNNTNRLNEQLNELVRFGKASTPTYAELTRRLGFEYNGMRLHELYFENLASRSDGLPHDSLLHERLATAFGRFESWQRDFVAVGKMRGVGWAVLYGAR